MKACRLKSLFVGKGCGIFSRSRRHANAPRKMGRDQRRKIIALYGEVLERFSSPMERESILPFSKAVIRRAICDELLENPDSEIRSPLEIGYARLESFLTDEEYEVMEEFKAAGELAERAAQSGSPEDILASARILKSVRSEHALKIQERITEMMQKRIEQIRSISMSAAGTCY
ncbi:MAG: hypothetical protein ACLGPL_02650 [Acidobacteriota bacterium]